MLYPLSYGDGPPLYRDSIKRDCEPLRAIDFIPAPRTITVGCKMIAAETRTARHENACMWPWIEGRRTMSQRDLLAAVVAVEPGCRGRDLAWVFAVEDRGVR